MELLEISLLLEKSYLTSRKQFTKLNDVLSDEIAVEYGVPQGSLIGPTGFSLNVNDMADNVCSRDDANNTEKGELDLFADDTTAYEVGNTVDEALKQIQGTANKFFDHSHRNSLTIHPEKCKILIVSRERFVGPL